MSKSGPVTILKLIVEFRSGTTIGLLYVFTLTKSYILYFYGVGSKLPGIVSHLGQNIWLAAVLLKLVSLAIFSSVFFYYFGDDRSAQF